MAEVDILPAAVSMQVMLMQSAQACAQLVGMQHTTWMLLHCAKRWSRHVSVTLMLRIMQGAPSIAVLLGPVQQTKILASYRTGY